MKTKMQMSNIVENVETQVVGGTYAANYFRNSEVLKNHDTDWTDEKQLELISKEIMNYRRQYKVNDMLYIYLKQEDLIISDSSVYEPIQFYKEHYDTSDMTYNGWKQKLKMEAEMSYQIYSMTLKRDGSQSHQNTLQFFSLDEGKNSSVLVMQGVESLPRNASDENEFVYTIFDENGEYVYVSEGFANKQLLQMKETEDIIKINGKKYIVAGMKSPTTLYTYFVGLDYYEGFRGNGYIYLYIVFVVLSAMVSILLLWYIIRRNYTFIDKIMDTFVKNRELQPDLAINEVEFINRMISKIDQENATYNKLIATQNIQLKSNYLSRLLRGSFDEVQAIGTGIIEANDIQFLSDYFAVTLFMVEDYTDFFEEGISMNEEEKIRMVRYAIKNVAEEMAGMQGNRGYVAEMEEIPTMIISFAPGRIEQSEIQLKSLCKRFKEFMESQLGITVTVSMSHVHKSLYGISIAYKETMNAMEYKFVLGEGTMISPDDVDEKINTYYLYTNEREQALTQYIKTGNQQQAEALLQKIFEEIDQQVFGMLNVRCLYFDILATLLKVKNDMGGKELAIDDQELAEEMLSQKSVEAVREGILKMSAALCQSYEQSQSELLESRVFRILKEYYMDPELSITYIANKLRMNHTYLSNVFKAQVGVGLLEYINRFRIKMACDMLQNTDDNIETIAKKVGYINASTFSRIFKKYTGITATQYRSDKD